MVAASKVVVPPNDNVAHALAGAAGGVLSMILSYPLITISTRAQVDQKKGHKSIIQTIKTIIATEGFSGLYSGLSSGLFGISFTNFVYYFWYEWTRSFLEKTATKTGRANKALTTLETMLAGAIAGSITVIATNPIWVVNTRQMTMANEKNSGETLTNSAAPRRKLGSLATAVDLLAHEGPMAFFRGVLPALVLVINPILQYTLYERLKLMIEKRKKLTPTHIFFLGALAKLFATTITYPYITVKSKMHVDSGKTKGMTAAISEVLQNEGYSGLYKGIGSKAFQSVFTAAFLFMFKDAIYEPIARSRMHKVVKA